MAYIEKESIGSIYGCFRCGEMLGELEGDEEGTAVCQSCGSTSIMTFQMALDTINELYVAGVFTLEPTDADYIDIEDM